jgi:hypothetical protein
LEGLTVADQNPAVQQHSLKNSESEKRELSRREFMDRAKKMALIAAPAVVILSANHLAIAQSGGGCPFCE